MADRYGRKWSLFTTAAWSVTFGLITASVNSFGILILLRFFSGLGLGGIHIAISMAMELSPAKNRWMLMMCQQVWFSFGGIL